jgi:MFS family permease
MNNKKITIENNIAKNNRNKIKRNIKVDYIYKFLSCFDITSAIWVLYLGYKGMSLTQIGLLESIFHITGFISEIPTGAMADLIGRKRIIVLGRFTALISAVIMLFSNSFIGFAIGFVLSAWGHNMNSGSEEALVYDSLKELNKEEDYLKINGKLNLIIEIAQGLAVFVGGLLADKNFDLSYIVAILIGIFALGASMAFKETSLIERPEKVTFIGHFKECTDTLKENKQLIKILIFFPLIFTFSAIAYFYGQQYFSDLGLSKSMIALIFLGQSAFSAVGAIFCDKIEKILKDKTSILISVLIGMSILLFGITKGFISILVFWSLGFFTSILQPISSNKINNLVESKQRATIISIDSMFFSLAMILLFPLSGYISENISMEIAFIVVGLINLIMVGICGVYLKRTNNKELIPESEELETEK